MHVSCVILCVILHQSKSLRILVCSLLIHVCVGPHWIHYLISWVLLDMDIMVIPGSVRVICSCICGYEEFRKAITLYAARNQHVYYVYN